MLDTFNRNIDCLRVSVTDRCNLKCKYCFSDDIELLDKNLILSFEELSEFIKSALNFGINKIRITGGEPLIRNGIIDFIAMLSKLDSVIDLSMTTNGVLLSQFAEKLKAAGLNRINVSLDTMDSNKFNEITGGGNLQNVIDGLQSAKAAGFRNIKLNCVVIKSFEEEVDAKNVKEFALHNGYNIRFIRKMNLLTGDFWPIEGGSSGDCDKCSRIRLSCDGRVFPCLFNDLNFSIKEFGNEKAILEAIKCKPEKGTMTNNKIRTIGG